MSNITYIPINKLIPHPQNPRKDLGDLTELAESIKANGVYQNLTVVQRSVAERADGTYTIIIGHRRHAAAKLAGLDKLPCAVVEMTEKQQVETMLLENMQRTDLTVIEEAQGLQLLIDLGDSVADIATHTGFSKAKIKSRLNLNRYDPAKVIKAMQNGATLEDYVKLSKFKDEALRKKCEAALGTMTFDYRVTEALRDEKWATEKEKVIEVLKRCGAKELKGYPNYNTYTLSKSAFKVSDAEEFCTAEEAKGRKIAFFCSSYNRHAALYYMKTADELESSKSADTYHNRYDGRRHLSEYIADLTKRLDSYINGFIAGFDEKSYLAAQANPDRTFIHIIKILIDNICRTSLESEYENLYLDNVIKICGFDWDALTTKLEKGVTEDRTRAIADTEAFSRLTNNPIRFLLAMYRSQIELDSCYEFLICSDDMPCALPKSTAHPAEMIRKLEVFGFQTPDELTQFIDGTHPIYTAEFCKKIIEEYYAAEENAG